MENTYRSGTLNRNSAATGTARAHAAGSRQSLEGEPWQRPNLGAGKEQARGTEDGTHPPNHRRAVGGQARLGTFGLPSITGRPRRYGQVSVFKAPTRSSQIAAEVKAPPSRRVTAPAAETPAAEQCRLGLTATQYQDYRETAPAPIRLRLSRERLGVFLALATIEQRSLEDVLADSVAETAGRLLRTRHELHLDPQDRADLNAYIDGIEAIEIEEGESAARILTTPAMRVAAAAADERERFASPDLEEFARPVSWGHVEAALVIEG